MKRWWQFFKDGTIGSILLLIPLSCCAFLMGMLTASEQKHLFKPYIDTIFSEDYSPEKFSAVSIGMSRLQVESIMGKPLYKQAYFLHSSDTIYHYTSDGKLLEKSKLEGKDAYADFAWYDSSLVIDSTGTVVSISRRWYYD